MNKVRVENAGSWLCSDGAFFTSVYIGSNLLLILLLLRFNPNQIFIILFGVNPFLMSGLLLSKTLQLSTLFSYFYFLIKLFIKNILFCRLKFTSKLDMIGRIDIEEIRSN